jgi:RNA polymerase sigma factor (sigma-70 family)
MSKEDTNSPVERKRKKNPLSASDESLDAYYNDLSRVRTLGADEEKGLFIKYRDNKDKDIRRVLVESCLKLVFSLARRYWMDKDLSTLKRLISSGNVGLLEAVERFDPERGTKFSSYASFWILLHIRNELTMQNDIVAPTSREKRTRMQSSYSREKVPEELRSRNTPVYIDLSDVPESELLSSGTVLVPNDDIDRSVGEASELFSRWFRFLTVREQFILRAYYGMMNDEDGLKLKQISTHLGLSSERVRQIKFDALAKLKRWMEHDGVTSYSDVF